MMAFLGEAIREMETLIAEVRGTVQFVQDAAHLRPRANPLINWEAVTGDTKSVLQRFLNSKAFQPDVAFRALYLTLYGGLEQFVRRVIRDVILTIDESVDDYDALDERIAKQNIRRTGEALATVFDPPDHVTVHYQTLCTNIGTCKPGASPFRLNADTFALFFSNLSPRQLEQVLRRIGVSLDWDDFGRQADVQSFFDTGRKTRVAARATQRFLGEFTRKRNHIAHSGAGGIVIGDSDVEEAAAFLEVFARALVVIAENKAPIPKRKAK